MRKLIVNFNKQKKRNVRVESECDRALTKKRKTVLDWRVRRTSVKRR